MPKITIRETDLTESSVTNVTTNAVYIPGYAVMGPINTPILCNTLQEFTQVFGSTPYIFRNAQPWPSEFSSSATPEGNFASAGDYEKSFIMAIELLKQGLPVYYERVFSGDVSTWSATATLTEDGTAEGTAALTLTASTPGLVTESIYYTLEEAQIDLGTQDSPNNVTYYILTVGRSANTALGAPEISAVSTKFTYSEDLASSYSSIKYVQDIQNSTDNSGLVTLSFNSAATEIAAVEQATYLTLSSAQPTNDEFTVQSMYTYLDQPNIDSVTQEVQGYGRFEDRGEYVLKYLTSGAYPVFEYNENSITFNILTIAANRGDAIALIDHTPNNSRSLAASNNQSVYHSVVSACQPTRVNTLGESIYSYGAMYTPYGIFDVSAVNTSVQLPGSYAYLLSLAVSVQNNPNWYAVAGVTRGSVPNILSLSQNITNAIAESYTPDDDISINPITNIRPYGLVIWGNRTLKNNAKSGALSATSFLNIRQLVSDIKRTIFVAAKTLTFEQNNDVLWINFKSYIVPKLEEMLQGNGITGYTLKRVASNEAATLKATVTLECVEAVENFDITVALTDSEITITE